MKDHIDEAEFLRVFEATLSELTTEIDFGDLNVDLSTELNQLDSNAFFHTLTKSRHRVQLPTTLLIPYFNDLLHEHTTDAQWLLGRSLWLQVTRPLAKAMSGSGRTTEVFDRIFQCYFIEWCLEILETGRSEACRMAAELFGVSETTLRRWYKGGKGAASGERMVAKYFVQILPQIEQALTSRGLG
jgi:hypothetical protein